MPRVSITSNVAQIKRIMQREQRSQLPFATARALTWTGRDAVADVEARIKRAFDRPTRFTQRAAASQPATRARMFARVLIRDAQARYLGIQEDGGERRPTGRAIVVPFGARLNQYGNLPRGGVRRMLARRNTFSGVVRGIGGIWERQRGGGVKLLVAYEQRVTYQPIFGWARTVERSAERNFPENFERSFRQAMQTAR